MNNSAYDALKTENWLNLNKTIAKDLFLCYEYPWMVLKNLSKFIVEFGHKYYDNNDKFVNLERNIWVAKSAKIDKISYLEGPLIIEENAKVRFCAYIRGSVIVGKNSVVGHSSEIKNSILFENVQVPHFNYVGDSILGANSHLGAGVILSNLRSDKKNVNIIYKNIKIDTNLKKFGAIIGENAEIGCNAVLNPGTILGKFTSVYPTSMVRGVVESNKIFKNTGEILDKIIYS